MKIPKEYRPLYKEELTKIRLSQLLLILFLGATILTIILVTFGILSILNLMLVPVFLYFGKKEINNLRLLKMMLWFTRYLIEPEMQKDLIDKDNTSETE